MKKLLTAIVLLTLVSTVFGAEIKTEIKVEATKIKPGKSQAMRKTGKNPFRDGELYYNAMPSTPAQGTAVKVIETKDDTDYICKIYELDTPGIVYEIKELLRPTIDKEDGKILSICNADTLKQYLIVTAPIFQFSFIEDVIFSLDQKGTRAVKSGSKYLVYECEHRLASDLQKLLDGTLLSGYGNLVIDDSVNKIILKDSPSWTDHAAKYLPMFDVPPKMVRVEAEIIEIEAGEKFDFGLALEAWKEALPEEINMDIDWNESKAGGGGGPGGWARSVAQAVRINGMRPKAMANFINYLVKTGNAKVVSTPTIVAMNGKEGTISSRDTVTYTAYSSPEEPLHKQTEVGLELKIKPIIASKTISLNIIATINSLVGYSESGAPIVNSRETTADIILQDGELFALSGLKKDTITKSNSGVPILQKIPLLGYFFRHEIDVKSTKEIVVFLTPKRVTANTSVEDREREILKSIKSEINQPPKSGTEKFIDRVILNKIDL